MAAPSRFASRFHEWAMRRGFPLLIRIAPILPRWFLFLGARVIMFTVMAVYPAPKRAIDRNLAAILELPADSRPVRRARRRMIYNLGYYWVDLFRFCQLPYERTRQLLGAVRGVDRLREAAAAGQGVVLMTAHLGNWELGGLFLRELGLPVSVVYVPDRSPTAETFRAFLRSRIEVEEIALDPSDELSSLPVLRALSAGRVVAMQGDRDFNDRGERVDFFGQPAPFPLGPLLLARITGAALLPVFIVYDADHRVEIEIGEAIEVPAGGPRRAAARSALAGWVEVLEAAVARWPDQWYTFYDFWQEGAGATSGGDPGGGETSAAGEPGERRVDRAAGSAA